MALRYGRARRPRTIILFKPITKVEKGEDGEADKTKTFPILKTWSVFNIAQVDGEIAEKYQVTTAPTGTRFENVDRAEFDRAVTATGADIRYGGNKAAYHRPPGDFIIVPHEEQFHDFPAYAETLLHELVHHSEWRTGWTGSYAEGELRAEIGACFLATAPGHPEQQRPDEPHRLHPVLAPGARKRSEIHFQGIGGSKQGSGFHPRTSVARRRRRKPANWSRPLETLRFAQQLGCSASFSK